jgi:hypothetical protein
MQAAGDCKRDVAVQLGRKACRREESKNSATGIENPAAVIIISSIYQDRRESCKHCNHENLEHGASALFPAIGVAALSYQSLNDVVFGTVGSTDPLLRSQKNVVGMAERDLLRKAQFSPKSQELFQLGQISNIDRDNRRGPSVAPLARLVPGGRQAGFHVPDWAIAEGEALKVSIHYDIISSDAI